MQTNLPPVVSDPLAFFIPNKSTNKIAMDYSTPEEIFDIIIKLKPSTSRDFYGVRSDIVRQVASPISLPLAVLVNECIQKGLFPDILKIAVVTPIYKRKGDNKDPENYRPISILPVFSKILEKVLKRRLQRYFETEGLLNNQQYGFRQKRSTTDALLDLSERILHGYEEGKLTSFRHYST